MRLAQHLRGHVGLYPNEIYESYAPMGLEGVSLVRSDPKTSLWCPEVVAPCSFLGAPCPGTYLGAAAADAVHQPLGLQVGVPALSWAVLLAVEITEHIRP